MSTDDGKNGSGGSGGESGSDGTGDFKIDDQVIDTLSQTLFEKIAPNLEKMISKALPKNDGGSGSNGDGSGDGGSGSDGDGSGKDGGSGKSPSLQEIVDAVSAKFEEQSSDDKQKVFNTLFNDKLSSVVSATPGLSDFLDSEDDYGNVRREQLLKITDYEDRLSALSKIASSYEEAVSGTNANRRPVVDLKAKKKVDDAEKKYSELREKLKKNEFSSIDDFVGQFMSAISEEASGLL